MCDSDIKLAAPKKRAPFFSLYVKMAANHDHLFFSAVFLFNQIVFPPEIKQEIALLRSKNLFYRKAS